MDRILIGQEATVHTSSYVSQKYQIPESTVRHFRMLYNKHKKKQKEEALAKGFSIQEIEKGCNDKDSLIRALGSKDFGKIPRGANSMITNLKNLEKAQNQQQSANNQIPPNQTSNQNKPNSSSSPETNTSPKLLSSKITVTNNPNSNGSGASSQVLLEPPKPIQTAIIRYLVALPNVFKSHSEILMHTQQFLKQPKIRNIFQFDRMSFNKKWAEKILILVNHHKENGLVYNGQDLDLLESVCTDF